MFDHLSPKEKVDVFVWQISHSHPTAWEYDYLLVEHSRSVSPHLLDAAISADKYIEQATILGMLSEMNALDISSLNSQKVVDAIKRCNTLSESDLDRVCVRISSTLQGKMAERAGE